MITQYRNVGSKYSKRSTECAKQMIENGALLPHFFYEKPKRFRSFGVHMESVYLFRRGYIRELYYY